MKDKLDSLLRKIVIQRDYSKPCVICGLGYMTEKNVVCHYVKRTHLATRWNLNNLNLGHSDCNSLEESDIDIAMLHHVNLTKRIGFEKTNELLRLKHTTIKYSEKDLKKMYKDLNTKLLKREI
jgi:5-methylcytosine-specific restriction endonuclease McrA